MLMEGLCQHNGCPCVAGPVLCHEGVAEALHVVVFIEAFKQTENFSCLVYILDINTCCWNSDDVGYDDICFELGFLYGWRSYLDSYCE